MIGAGDERRYAAIEVTMGNLYGLWVTGGYTAMVDLRISLQIHPASFPNRALQILGVRAPLISHL
jgi:hypothetical protein